MDSTATKILKLLYQHDEGLGFRDIMEQLGISQAPLQRRLKRLTKEKYIIVSNIKEWHQGQRKIHTLTEKGKKSLERDFGTMLEEFSNKLAEALSEMPIEKWRQSALSSGVITEKEFLTPMVFAEFIHKIHAMLLPKPLKDSEMYVGAFRKNDHVVLDIIPKQLVEEWKSRSTQERS